MGREINHIGAKVGLLTVIARATEKTKSRCPKWLCQCACGGTTIRTWSEINRPRLVGCRSCLGQRIGELTKGNKGPRSHGAIGSRLYRIWKAMRHRCNGTRSAAYRFYGAKGVIVCPEWDQFETFKAWALGHDYRDPLTIERINPRGNYEPSNCEWITLSENSRRARQTGGAQSCVV